MERSISQRFTAMLLCVCLMIGSLPFSALHGYASKNERSAIGGLGGYLQGAMRNESLPLHRGMDLRQNVQIISRMFCMEKRQPL